MAVLSFNHIGIKAVSACIPKNISSNYDLGHLLPREEVEKTINSIGIKEKRYADKDVCSSDLCFKAAEKLISDNETDKNKIDVLIFLSQTPDYKIPMTSPSLQHRLGLLKSTVCFDMNVGCSGYIYGLSTAFAYASLEGINSVLLLVGETFSKIVNPNDKVNVPLYGDAGTATLIEKGNYGKSYFTLYADGAGFNSVIIPAGQCRIPTTQENLMESEKEDGNIRSENELFMDGMDVFNFALKVVPKGVTEIIELAGIPLTNVDYLIFHQANRFMTDFFVKKLKYSFEKVPYCMDKYGNTSSSSIPLTISSQLAGKSINNKTVVMSGFGAGLSWGTLIYTFTDCKISEIIEY
ncbi:MAG: ketoacyl-ACP synthase III [Bacteroidetes bacterium]|nr:ketoacyl-ACP synthase III [Bacteroidota bacterium]